MARTRQGERSILNLKLEEIERVALTIRADIRDAERTLSEAGLFPPNYERRGADGTKRGRSPTAALHPLWRYYLPVFYRLATLHANFSAKEARRGMRLTRGEQPTLARLRSNGRADCLKRWKVWDGDHDPDTDKVRVWRWRRWSLTAEQTDRLILEVHANPGRVGMRPDLCGKGLGVASC
jgi:hypothetical protein